MNVMFLFADCFDRRILVRSLPSSANSYKNTCRISIKYIGTKPHYVKADFEVVSFSE